MATQDIISLLEQLGTAAADPESEEAKAARNVFGPAIQAAKAKRDLATPGANPAPNYSGATAPPQATQAPFQNPPVATGKAPPVPTSIPVAPVPPPTPRSPVAGPTGASGPEPTSGLLESPDGDVVVRNDVPSTGNKVEDQPSAPGVADAIPVPPSPSELLMKMYGNHFDEAKARSIRDVARQEEGGSRAGTSAVFASMMEPGKAPTALMLEQNKPYNRPLESDTLHKSMDAGDESLKAQASQMEYDPRGEYAAQIRTGIMASPAYDRMAQEVAKANGEDPKAVRLRMNKNLETASPATMKAVANQVGVDLDQYVKRATGRGEEARGTLTSEMASKEMLEVIKNAASIPAMLHPESEASRALQGAAEEGLSLPPGTLKSMNGITILHSKMMEAPVVQLRVKAIMQNFDTAAKTAAPVAPGVTQPTTMVQTQLRGVGILSVPPNSEQAVAGVTDNTNKIEIVRREAQAIMEMERRYSRGGQVASSVFGADKWQEYTDHARQLKAAADSLGNPQLTKAVGELTSLTTSGAAGDVRASMLQNRDRAAAQALALAEQKYQGLLNPLIVKPTISETDRASGIIPKAIPRQYDIGKDGRLYSQFRMDSGNVVYGYRDPASGNYVKWYKSIR